MPNPFTTHPASVNESYCQHCGFALRFGFKMMTGGIAALLHAFFPFLFIKTASRLCDELQQMRQNSLGRKQPINMVESRIPPSNNPCEREST